MSECLETLTRRGLTRYRHGQPCVSETTGRWPSMSSFISDGVTGTYRADLNNSRWLTVVDEHNSSSQPYNSLRFDKDVQWLMCLVPEIWIATVPGKSIVDYLLPRMIISVPKSGPCLKSRRAVANPQRVLNQGTN